MQNSHHILPIFAFALIWCIIIPSCLPGIFIMQTNPRIIKKYPNRRLYDTGSSRYITISDVRDMVAANENIKVVDAKTGADLTHQTFLQIILEAEGAASAPLFSTSALGEFIRLYGSAMQGAMSQYMDSNLSVFFETQKKFAEQAANLATSGTKAPQAWAEFISFQEAGRA